MKSRKISVFPLDVVQVPGSALEQLTKQFEDINTGEL